jgi:hypothetical protein
MRTAQQLQPRAPKPPKLALPPAIEVQTEPENIVLQVRPVTFRGTKSDPNANESLLCSDFGEILGTPPVLFG